MGLAYSARSIRLAGNVLLGTAGLGAVVLALLLAVADPPPGSGVGAQGTVILLTTFSAGLGGGLRLFVWSSTREGLARRGPTVPELEQVFD
jgi:hypothetical protein